MPLEHAPPDLPELVDSGMDACWTDDEQGEVLCVTRQLAEAVAAMGHPTRSLLLPDENLADCLYPYDPAACIVFNWCEGFPGQPHSEPLVAKGLESLSFVFTGASSDSLALAEDKTRIKERLEGRASPPPNGGYSTGRSRGNGRGFPPSSRPPANTAAKGSPAIRWS
jgi:hypothetical protein